jgi:acyl CoA:acetate/3-ketoacid CoA transferase beta subunit
VLDVTPAGLRVAEVLPGSSRDEIIAATEAQLIW